MKYICDFYIPVPNDEGRYFALSACDKASYVFSVMNRLGYTIEVISPSYAKKTSRQRTDRLNDYVTIASYEAEMAQIKDAIQWHEVYL